MSLQLITVFVNFALALLKFTVGLMAGSTALIADAFNSAGDVLATFVAWLAFRYAQTPPDANHHYGHQNAEALAGLVLGGVLCATGLFIGINGVLAMAEPQPKVAPDQVALWAAAATAVIKEVLFRVSIRVGRATNSPTLLAAARDHRADVVSGTVALLGIFVARQGWPQFDAIAAIVIGIYIFALGLAPVRSNVDILMHAAPAELATTAARIAEQIPGVRAVRQVRVQPIGGHYRMDMVILVDGDVAVRDAHRIAHLAEERVRRAQSNVTEVYVHVEPAAL